ncbi:hypothetical protein [Streptomyces tunisiensis]|uniref:hypothetical protein n=1 Tax=Streptomyces tunisiensis TaxID=948699 RepID=UPI003EE29299
MGGAESANLPEVVLPADSRFPTVGPLEFDGWRVDFSAVRECLHRPLPEPLQLRNEISRAQVSLAGALSSPLTEQRSSSSAEQILLEHLEDEHAAEVEKYVVYDKYFGVTRSRHYGAADLAREVSLTISRTLEDLAGAIIDVDEFDAIVDVSEILLRYCAGGAEAGSENGQSGISSSLKDPMYRWRVGHHFFAFSALMCRHALEAIAGRDPLSLQETVNLLADARISLRGTTAAMRYGANMSQQAYGDIVRPSMEAAWPGGFSGTQHLDYERLKRTREAALERLLREHGKSPSDWPAEVRVAFGAFCETELEDLEQHTLLAASKVGTGSSLLAEATGGSGALAAVKQLRSMAVKRQRDLAKYLV